VLRVLGAQLGRLPLVDSADIITWVPASVAGRRRRGYDQGRILARALARQLNVPVRPLLRRAAGQSQAGKNRLQRIQGPVFRAATAAPKTVLLVDDVVATGASLSAAAVALRGAGADFVIGVAAAASVRPADLATNLYSDDTQRLRR